MISRRTVLRGLGTAIALPYLEAMAPLTALASSPAAPLRMGFIFVPNGMSMPQWTPAAAGPLQLSPLLQEFESIRDSINVLSGLAQMHAFANGDGPGDHARSASTWLTGVQAKKTAGAEIHSGVSVDQVAAQRLRAPTALPSLEIGCERSGVAGDCDSGYSCAYSSNISWRGPSQPNPKETNPRLVFDRLFGTGGTGQIESRELRNRYRLSIIDMALGEANRLRARLGVHDQRKLDEYLTSVRELELRVERSAQASVSAATAKSPEGVPNRFDEHIRLMGDMMVLAFQADLTRVCTFMIANEGSNRGYTEIGVSDGHHEVSHHGKDTEKLRKKLAIDQFHTAQVAYILKKMHETKELGSNLLANSMIVYGAGISDGDMHNHDHLPILLAGSAGGRLKTGRHLVYENGTPLNNLYLAMLDKLGVPTETLGDSTGLLKPLF